MTQNTEAILTLERHKCGVAIGPGFMDKMAKAGFDFCDKISKRSAELPLLAQPWRWPKTHLGYFWGEGGLGWL
ncbi:hypothetical protein ALUC_60636S [Aspergillus luchuensis]|nr:hypothetical protein ALUC_60636S [Aspergillus luchuensis]